jgi:hypothetical protein
MRELPEPILLMEKRTSFTNWSLSARTRSESEKMFVASDGDCSEGIVKRREKPKCTEREKWRTEAENNSKEEQTLERW